ncbi:hypothetical protein [Vallicoccus soli]|uniref:Uncharacterized protein n=1 Tax=Vallicoccus soli TaxID=2339232 RepID=A0A3A3Z1B6_9ACTN|nr:hypothetical protein [Vallicoccus soli]RJK96297.1 hypothetical protein D5H78_08555 [Vallicoccus soli]
MARADGLSRRAVLAAGLGLAVAGCSSDGAGGGSAAPSAPAPGTPSARPTATPPSPSPSAPAPSPTVALPSVEPWRPVGDEQRPEVKLAATAAVQALLAVPAGGGGAAAARARLDAAGVDPGLLDGAGSLLPPSGPSVAQVVYPSYGGLLDDDASVITVVRQWWVQDGEVAEREVIADVRLRRRSGGWRVREVRPAVAGAVDLARVEPAARAVLEAPSLQLPDPARQDVARLAVPELLALLTALGERHELQVVCLRSGHPREVYGTTRDSNHWRGRAVDIWAVDGVPVVTMEPDDRRLLAFLAEGRDLGATEIGSPADPDGPQEGCRGRVFFANELHRDHVHFGFDRVPKPTCG